MNRELAIWLAAAVLFIAGDLITTVYGLGLGHQEAHPVGAWLMAQIGIIPAIVLGKVLVFGTAITFAFTPRFRPDDHAEAIPLSLAVLGVVIVSWNLLVIL